MKKRHQNILLSSRFENMKVFEKDSTGAKESSVLSRTQFVYIDVCK